MQKEEWRHVNSLPPDIEVSSMGQVRRYTSMTTTQLVNQTKSAGLYIVSIHGKTYQVHRLIAEAFVPNLDPEHLTLVKHKNEDKLDNRFENLEWISRVTNISQNPFWKTDSRDRVYCVELDKVFATMRSAAILSGVPQELISVGIKAHKPVFGLTFTKIEASDPKVNEHNIHYIDYNTLCEIAFNSTNLQQGRDMILAAVGDGCPV